VAPREAEAGAEAEEEAAAAVESAAKAMVAAAPAAVEAAEAPSLLDLIGSSFRNLLSFPPGKS